MGKPPLQFLDGLAQATPVLHRLPDAGDIQRLRFEHEGPHEGGGIEDRLERHRVREGAQEMARFGHRRALAHQAEEFGGEALARCLELVEGGASAAQVLCDLGPGRHEASTRRLAHVIRDLEAMADMDEARERGLAALLGAGREGEPRRDHPAGGLVLEHQHDQALAGLPGGASALGGVADPAEAVIAHGAGAAPRGRGVQREAAGVVAGQDRADRVEDRRLAGPRRSDQGSRTPDPDLLAADQVPVGQHDVGEAVHGVSGLVPGRR